MAMNPLPHMMIGDIIWYRLQLTEALRPACLLGSVAADGYRVVPGLNYRPTHFRGLSADTDPVIEFADHYLSPALKHGTLHEQAFRFGWLGHLVADQVWRHMLRHDCPELWASCTRLDIQRRQNQRRQYRESCATVDCELEAAQPGYVDALRRMLHSASPNFPVSPMTSSVVARWTDALVRHGLPPKSPAGNGGHIVTVEMVRRAIEQSAAETIAILGHELSHPAQDSDSSLYI